MAGEVVVDALPYIDQGYDEPGVREAAFAMVEEECRRYRPTKNYLEHLPPLNISCFETTMMHNEFERLQNRLPMDTLSMKRYELPPPPSGKLNEVGAWLECVDNSQAQLEHQAVRILNLHLMLEFCCPAWQRYLQTLTDLEKIASKKLTELRQSLQEVNWQRKSLQTKGGEQLKSLEAKWVSLVSHNYEIEQACCMAEEYLVQLKQNPAWVRYERQLQLQQEELEEKRRLQHEQMLSEHQQPLLSQSQQDQPMPAEDEEADGDEQNEDMEADAEENDSSN